MVSELAKGDWEDMRAAGLDPTLEDFDRLNQLALRLTDGAETTAANHPRIGWAGDVPFHEPTCAAFSWYLDYVDRAGFKPALKDAAWFYALAHARDDGVFAGLENPVAIRREIKAWLNRLPVTRGEVARACRYAATGFEDAEPGRTDAQREREAARTEEERRAEALESVSASVTVASALTGVAPEALMRETPSRLAKMVEAVRLNNPMWGGAARDVPRLRADYDLAFREIRRRLASERAAKEAGGCDGGL